MKVKIQNENKLAGGSNLIKNRSTTLYLIDSCWMFSTMCSLGANRHPKYESYSLRSEHAFYTQDFNYSLHSTRTCDARPTQVYFSNNFHQTYDQCDDILDKLEQSGRVPSKDKFRRMACNVSDFLCPTSLCT